MTTNIMLYLYHRSLYVNGDRNAQKMFVLSVNTKCVLLMMFTSKCYYTSVISKYNTALLHAHNVFYDKSNIY